MRNDMMNMSRAKHKEKPESPGGIEPKTFRTPVEYSNKSHKSFIYDMHPAYCYNKQCWNRHVCGK